jgi:hypothetical protein
MNEHDGGQGHNLLNDRGLRAILQDGVAAAPRRFRRRRIFSARMPQRNGTPASGSPIRRVIFRLTSERNYLAAKLNLAQAKRSEPLALVEL